MIVRVSLNQICYMVTPIVILAKHYPIEFYEITNGNKSYNGVNKIEFEKYGMIKNNLYKMTIEDFTKKAINDYKKYKDDIIYIVIRKDWVFKGIPTHIYNNITFTCAHGIDEESYVKVKKFSENIKDFVIYRAVSGISKDLIKNIYKLDDKKKTILFQDSVNSFFFSRYHQRDAILIDYQNRMIDDLIKLKDDYNVIIRFHPMFYHGMFLGHDSVAKRVHENFIVDFTQLSLKDLYDISDVVISSRYTSSGYQSILEVNKKMIIIDMDLDTRKKCIFHKHWIVREKTNQEIKRMIENEEIFNGNIGMVGNEKNIDLYKYITKGTIDDNVIQNRKEFLKLNFDIDDNDFDDNDEIYFLIYVLSQTNHNYQHLLNKLINPSKSKIEKFLSIINH